MNQGLDHYSSSMQLSESFLRVRNFTELLCKSLEIEDYGLQAGPFVSPPQWHLAHTTWFFERFVLTEFEVNYRNFHPQFDFLFNSYYETAGRFFERSKRGLLSRPTVQEIYRYRSYVNERLLCLIEQKKDPVLSDKITQRVVLGIHHEQQHQELLLTDIKYNFSINPLRPAYLKNRSWKSDHSEVDPFSWLDFDGGLKKLGHNGKGFAFDNEGPCHSVYLESFQLGSRLITNGEYLEFIEDGAYARPELWLSDAWSTVKSQNWNAPLYWEKDGCNWNVMTLFGMQPLNLSEPVCHVSYYEADAFARWRSARLPLEAEWEVVAKTVPQSGNFVESELFHPLKSLSAGLSQMYGDLWEWTSSSYAPYPGYQPVEGPLGEYNGKFMCSQMVLRGGSFATSVHHIRSTYRNFFQPDSRWQFMGLRLARNAR
jgi:ergothioneine biosynthesis protein EgtB